VYTTPDIYLITKVTIDHRIHPIEGVFTKNRERETEIASIFAQWVNPLRWTAHSCGSWAADSGSSIVGMETMMAHQAMAPAFLFYTRDPNPQSRQQGHFVPHPHPHHPAALQHHMTVFPVVPTLTSSPMYSRPNSSNSQVQVPHPKVLASMPLTLPTLASPQPIAHKPTMVLDTDVSDADGMYYPSTPPLSSSGSVISSPGSYDMLQTPSNPMFSGLDGKETCEFDGVPENFLTLDWSSCPSPTMTPGTYSEIFLKVAFWFNPKE